MKKLRPLVLESLGIVIFFCMVVVVLLIITCQPTVSPTGDLQEVGYTHLSGHQYDAHVVVWQKEVDRHLRCKESVECMKLAEVGYYEARGESDEGVLLVMKTVMNRAEHKRWKNSIVGVVNEPHQFSYLWDGSLEKARNNPKQWKRMYHLAHKMLNGDLTFPKSWGSITHYHSVKVKPFWAKHYKQITLVGNHIAYKCEKDC